MHFQPEWDNEQVAHARLSQQLARRFTPTPFLAGPESIFPRRWATHGCTQWALKTCVDFLTGFESLSSISAKAANFAGRLSG
jgi:hypothetical protein